MAWAYQDCDSTLRLGKRWKDFSHNMKEKLQEEEELRQKAEDTTETRGAELKTVQAELAELK